jgi:hypothetical protein
MMWLLRPVVLLDWLLGLGTGIVIGALIVIVFR